MPLDLGYDELSSRTELRAAILVLLRMTGETVDIYNRKAEKDGTPTIRKGKLERFTANVEAR